MWEILFDVLILLAVSLALGALAERFKQSAILGYLLAGTLVGPHALGLVEGGDQVTALAELGVAMLLFSIGLEFSFKRLRRMGAAALVGGPLQVIVTMILAGGVAMLFGASLRSAAAIGAMVALSSTACVLRLLVRRAEMDAIHGRCALGILLVQDIAVVPLVLLVSVFSGGGTAGEMAGAVVKTLVLGGLLIGAFYVLFNYVVPLLLNTSTMQRNRELPVLLAIVVGFGSTVAAHEFGLSPALGAFVAGMLLAESPFATQIRADVGGLRTLLMTLFFSSIGMLGDPAWIIANVIPVVALVAAIVVGKALIVLGLMRAFGVNLTSAIAAGVCLAQVGEFSFVLAAVGRDGAITEYQFMLMVSATIVSLFLTTFLVTFARPIALRIERGLERFGLVDRTLDETPDAPLPLKDHIILVGYGPAGQAVAETLIDSDYSVAVIDLNRKAISNAQTLGFHAMIGDATHADVLEHFNVAEAAVVVITLPDPTATNAIIRLSKSMGSSPGEPAVLARARYHIHQLEIAFAGADIVIDEERQVGQRLAAALRRYVRKTAKQAAEDAETIF